MATRAACGHGYVLTVAERCIACENEKLRTDLTSLREQVREAEAQLERLREAGDELAEAATAYREEFAKRGVQTADSMDAWDRLQSAVATYRSLVPEPREKPQ